jgi:hypothetical protein
LSAILNASHLKRRTPARRARRGGRAAETVIHGGHSPENRRDPRGFAVKFYTEDGK